MPNLRFFISHPKSIAIPLVTHFCKWLPDSLYLRLLFRAKMGRKLHLKNPQTFSEKLQWLKLYNRRPEYTTMVDKYAVKEYVASKIGEKYIIPTLGVWDKAEDIDWDYLPNKFVLKTTHSGGSTGVVICKDKERFDRQKAIKILKDSLNDEYYSLLREWPYKNVPHRILAEKYIDPTPKTNDLSDYIFFCFDGEVKALFIATERQKEGEEVKFDFFDADFNHLPFKQGHENSKVIPEKPRFFAEMKEVASELSKGIPHARIDFYEVEDKVLFGEITFFHFSGLTRFQPDKWDKILGEMLTLPGENRGGVIIRLLQNNRLTIVRPDLLDYKFFCFNGEPKYCQVISGRDDSMSIDFFDKDWNHQPFHEPKSYPFAETELVKPVFYEKMWSMARQLAVDKPFSRIDFYEVFDKIYFGEITFYPTSGFGGFSPSEYDTLLGQMIQLPIESK